jgi:D-alanine-D-alanine ligase
MTHRKQFWKFDSTFYTLYDTIFKNCISIGSLIRLKNAECIASYFQAMKTPLRIGICYDRPEDYPEAAGPADRFAEFEPESTIEAMEAAIRWCGHIPVRAGAPHALLKRTPEIDVLWNIAEGFGTRNRESWAPVLAEMRGISCLGSDALSLGISLDKARTKEAAKLAGIPVTAHFIVKAADAEWNFSGAFPVFVKPRYEGTAKGISKDSVCRNEAELRVQVEHLRNAYRQDILIEPFLGGAEYTCAVAGAPLQVLDVLERALHTTTRIGLHAVEAASGEDEPWTVTHSLPEALDKNIRKWSLDLCEALEIKHWARLDFKLDDAGNPFLLEINPLPTFGIDQTFAILAEISGKAYPAYLGELLSEALRDIRS